MHRRHFMHHFLLGSLGLQLFARFKPMHLASLVRPAALKPGDQVALIAPAGPALPERIETALANIAALGLRVLEGRYLREQNGYFSGTDAERLQDLHAAFADTTVQAVWCVRGGYGCTRLLPDVDFKLIKRHPKLFIGYSDITALHVAIREQTGLMTFHGPIAAAPFTPFSEASLRRLVFEGMASDWSPIAEKKYTLHPGQARGPLTGGNLTVLTALSGTPWEPDFKNGIVALEDVGERPYRIDRMLTQLLQATNLRQAAGIALGDFTDCDPKPGEPSLTLEEVLRDRLGKLGIPVVGGFPFGHIDEQMTWGYGDVVTLGG
ncbi:MAG: S66 peptidase family protein [Saprospiraceae bacterium]